MDIRGHDSVGNTIGIGDCRMMGLEFIVMATCFTLIVLLIGGPPPRL